METLGRYQILEEIGRGGCGTVYSAMDPRIGRKVAIKTIDAKSSPTMANNLSERFRREARAAGILSHPNIVTIHEFDDSGDPTFLVMEFIDGRTLSDWMAQGRILPLELVFSILRSAAEALDFAHSQNIIHRDVKPSNFLITNTGILKIADFGIAKMDGDTSLTSTGMVIGTAQYMSPEQIAAKTVTGRSDQFSLAEIAYELLTGQKPFHGDSWATLLHQILYTEPEPVTKHRGNLPEQATDVLRRGMAKDPAQRYPSCRDFVEDLANVFGMATQERRTGNTPRIHVPPAPAAEDQETIAITSEVAREKSQTRESQPPRRLMMIPVAAGAVILAIAGAAWWIARSRTAPVAQPAAAPVQIAETRQAPLPEKAAQPAEPTATKSRPEPEKKRASSSTNNERPAPAPSRPDPPKIESPAQQNPVQIPVQQIPTPQAPPPVIVTQPAQVKIPIAEPAPSRPTEAEAWDRLKNSTDIAALDQFRHAYPGGSFTAQATHRMEQLDWERIQRSGDEKAIRDYLAKYPGGSLSDRATAELARLQKNRESAAQVKMVHDTLNRFRDAFEHKDMDALKAVWTGLSRNEINSIQNFFRIARSIKVDLQPLGEPSITASGAAIRCRRIVSASDDRGAMPTQDQTINIRMAKSGDSMVIEAIEISR